jgi:hypothetical protein
MADDPIRGFEIVIPCPTTGELIQTGVDVLYGNLDTIPDQPMMVAKCPACGQPHTWSRSTALLRRRRAASKPVG